MNQIIEVVCGRNIQNVNLDIPNECPLCHISLLPTVLYSQLVKLDTNNYEIVVIYYCPNCKNTFFGKYCCSLDKCGYIVSHNVYTPKIIPVIPKQLTQHKQIKTISPKFLDIYAQAQQGESDGLEELCGMGYRKALEFLVKDYAIHFNPDDIEKITKMPLLQCINKYIDVEGIKALSVASVWLGNDETHYERRNQNQNLNSMKKYIDSIVYFICMKLNAEEAQKYIECNN